jgi:hypothetical protein
MSEYVGIRDVCIYKGYKICSGRNPTREQKQDSRAKFGKETVAGAQEAKMCSTLWHVG